MTITEIIEGCRLGGIMLEQRLTVCGEAEAKLIVAELARRKAIGRIHFASAGATRKPR